jgi:transcriptional regulator PpsR
MQRPVVHEPIRPFRDPAAALSAMDADSIGAALTAASDIALIIDRQGVIQDVAYNGVEIARDGVADWIGKAWIDTVAEDSVEKIAEILAAGMVAATAARRQVNHISPKGGELPVSYSIIPIGEGRRLALGRERRSLSALQHRLVETHHATEREYARLRDAEMRYRLLFQMSEEALLIVDAASRKIVEANPAAEALLGGGQRRLAGRLFPVGFAADDTPNWSGSRRGRGPRGASTARGCGWRTGPRSALSAALFRQDASAFLLFRIGAGGHRMPEDMRAAALLLAAAPEGYVATDAAGVIRWTNTAFLNLAQLATEEQAIGQALERFLGRPGVDMNVLLSTLREKRHGAAVRDLAAGRVRLDRRYRDLRRHAAAFGGDAVRLPHPQRRDRAAPRARAPCPAPSSSSPSWWGGCRCGSGARDHRRDRAALHRGGAGADRRQPRLGGGDAAPGLSRQSLYVKLRRYGPRGGALDSGDD